MSKVLRNVTRWRTLTPGGYARIKDHRYFYYDGEKLKHHEKRPGHVNGEGLRHTKDGFEYDSCIWRRVR